MQADLKKCRIFDWKKRSTEREEVHRGGEGSHRAVGPDEKKKKEMINSLLVSSASWRHDQYMNMAFSTFMGIKEFLRIYNCVWATKN